jgi:arylsulfatase A-like enzyme
VDDLVSRVFVKLRELDEAKDTLAFYLSDNGFMWYEHGVARKRKPYDDSVCIPFYARWPGNIAAGSVDRRIVATVDVAPTVYDAAGINPTYPADGRNVLDSARRYILFEYFKGPETRQPTWRGLWSRRWAYIKYPERGFRREYYAPGDRWQLRNRYRDGVRGNEPKHEDRLDAMLRQAFHCTGASCP